MIDANYSVNINQNYFNNTTSIDKNTNLADAEQMDSIGNGLFDGEDNMELLTLLLQLIMQLIQSLDGGDNDDSSGGDAEQGDGLEGLLRHNLFMSLLTESPSDVGDTDSGLFSDDDEDDSTFYF